MRFYISVFLGEELTFISLQLFLLEGFLCVINWIQGPPHKLNFRVWQSNTFLVAILIISVCFGPSLIWFSKTRT